MDLESYKTRSLFSCRTIWSTIPAVESKQFASSQQKGLHPPCTLATMGENFNTSMYYCMCTTTRAVSLENHPFKTQKQTKVLHCGETGDCITRRKWHMWSQLNIHQMKRKETDEFDNDNRNTDEAVGANKENRSKMLEELACSLPSISTFKKFYSCCLCFICFISFFLFCNCSVRLIFT